MLFLRIVGARAIMARVGSRACRVDLQQTRWHGCITAVVSGLAVALVANLVAGAALGTESGALRGVLVATLAVAAAALAGALAWMVGMARENARLRRDVSHAVGVVQHADRLASLGLVAAGIAHEVSTPLVALQTFAQLLPTRWNDPEFRREYSEVVLSEIERTGVLVNDLLQLARSPAAPSPRVSSIESITAILPVLRAQAEHKDVTLEFEGGAETPDLAADATQLRQVVMNLVLNAIEATPPGGSIQVSCGRAEGGDDAHVFVRVRDSGPGIAAADLAHVFEPFSSPRREGSGLGLAVTREIVHAHGGTIDVQSTPGRGTTFVVELPAADSAAGRSAFGPIPTALAGG